MADYLLGGPWRQPRNTPAHEKDGIHDDATARGLGFSGGTVTKETVVTILKMDRVMKASSPLWADAG